MADNNQPATKQDLLDLKGEIKQDILNLEDRLVETMRDMQTELLRAFHQTPHAAHNR